MGRMMWGTAILRPFAAASALSIAGIACGQTLEVWDRPNSIAVVGL